MGKTGDRERRITQRFVDHLVSDGWRLVPKNDRRKEWKRADACLRKDRNFIVAEVKAGGETVNDTTKKTNFDRGMSSITERMVGYKNMAYVLALPPDRAYQRLAAKIPASFKETNKFRIWIVPEKGKPYVFKERRKEKKTRGLPKRRVRSSKGVSSFLTGLPPGEYSYSKLVELAHKNKVESNDKQGLPHAVASALQMQKKQGKVRSLEHGRWRILKRPAKI
ncbi:hypothetical protein E3J62_02080 [candidate division TA06 bacterium]|uniref:Uncharacterized protein n=1 Tax=candidate division TA06 bacterium TaxID=2250710 RepID=A0A523UY24_UNCT6|nr:MAG: hypothetical protein E3J62_02080 [candidate division TA06 bacterium]